MSKATPRALEQFDAWLPDFERQLNDGDLAILTADHGCDPTTPSTDHSREYVPVLAFGPDARAGVTLGVRATLSDLGQTVAENFGVSDRERNQLLTSNRMRKPVMAGNWKMYKTPAETTSVFREIPAAGGERRALRDRDLPAFPNLPRR